jgi:hypothetical protein
MWAGDAVTITSKGDSPTPLAYMGTPLAMSVALAVHTKDWSMILYGAIAAALGFVLMRWLPRSEI